MSRYLVTTPAWLRLFFSRKLLWEMPVGNAPAVYLTFDDGPDPIATPFVLTALKEHKAAATFFCVGNKVVQYKDLFETIAAAGHSIGNHTYDHLNGWETDCKAYIENINMAADVIGSNLFRPPYGTHTQATNQVDAKKLEDMYVDCIERRF